MKIIFDSEEQKKQFMLNVFSNCMGCPADVGLRNAYNGINCSCRECWEAAIDIEVRSCANCKFGPMNPRIEPCAHCNNLDRYLMK